jgi:hypothetical protein
MMTAVQQDTYYSIPADACVLSSLSLTADLHRVTISVTADRRRSLSCTARTNMHSLQHVAHKRTLQCCMGLRHYTSAAAEVCIQRNIFSTCCAGHYAASVWHTAEHSWQDGTITPTAAVVAMVSFQRRT